MKTKEEILKMSKKEILTYKWHDDLASNCSHCFDCSGCSHCSHCYSCRNAKKLKYAICNVVMTKKEYELKMKEINK